MLADLARRDDAIAFDLFGDRDLRAARIVKRHSLTALVDAAVEEEPGAVIYGASFENHPKLVERLGERHRLLGNTPETLRAVRDPVRLAAALGEWYPRTTFTPPSSGRWLRKPLRGGGGIRVRDWRGGALPRGTFLQERIEGVPCSVAATGDVVLGISEQLVGQRAFGTRGYRWCGNLVPPRVPVPLDQAQEICSRLAGEFGLRGPFGVDFVWDGERARVIEVNPRTTASFEVIEPVRAAGKAVLFATEDMAVGDTDRWLERGVRDVPHSGERIAKGRPICTVVTTAETPDEALARLEEEAAALLEVTVCG
jgi:hypothetical protein